MEKYNILHTAGILFCLVFLSPPPAAAQNCYEIIHPANRSTCFLERARNSPICPIGGSDGQRGYYDQESAAYCWRMVLGSQHFKEYPFSNLSFLNLNEINIEGFDMNRARFEATQLERANLKKANFESACFQYTNLRGADLTGARLRSTDCS